MFVIYFGVASVITPPVAIVAYAAASIAGAGPMAIGITAFRIGLAMFIVPFAFAFYPQLLLTKESGDYELGSLSWICARLTISLWLLTSVLSRYDSAAVPGWEVIMRLVLALTVLLINPVYHGVAVVIALALFARP